MSDIDTATLKSAVTAAGANYGALLTPEQRSVPRQSSHRRREIDKVLRSYFMKSGLDVPRLEEMLAQDRNEFLRSIALDKANAAKQGPIDKQTTLARMVNRPPFANPLPTPDFSLILQPFAIVQPGPSTFTTYLRLDTQIGSTFSSLFFEIRATSSDHVPDFIFYFQWQNPKGASAYVDLATTLTFSGSCTASADGGLLNGETTSLDISAYLNPLQWWIQPVPGVYQAQATQKQDVIALSHSGPGFFGGPFDQTDPFPLLSRNLSYVDFEIPLYSTAVFAVGVKFSCNMSGSSDADYASAYSLVNCPGLRLTERPTES